MFQIMIFLSFLTILWFLQDISTYTFWREVMGKLYSGLNLKKNKIFISGVKIMLVITNGP